MQIRSTGKSCSMEREPPMPRLGRTGASRRGGKRCGFFMHRGGTASVEFAIIALPFLAIVGFILQIAFQIWATQNFDRALQGAVRNLFTGRFQIETAGQTDAAILLATLKTKMCGPASATIANVFNCQNVRIDVATAGTFAAATPTVPVDTATGTWTTEFGRRYECAKPGTIVIVTAAVPFPSFFTLLGLDMRRFSSGSDTGSALLKSVAVFRTEPYQTNGASAC